MPSVPACMSATPRRVISAAAASMSVLTLTYRAVFGSRSQWFGAFPFEARTDERLVALTFDDGPNEPHTSRLLDVLAAREVPGTFFQVGRCVERWPAVSQRMVEAGHIIGNHSYSHSFSTYASQPRQREEIQRGQDAIFEVTGHRPVLYRPPWLCHLPWVLRSVSASGSQVVSGTFAHPLEVFQPSPARIAACAARSVRPGTMVIMHDGRDSRGGDRENTVTAVGLLIDRLRDRGYSFGTVDQLLGIAAYR